MAHIPHKEMSVRRGGVGTPTHVKLLLVQELLLLLRFVSTA